MIGDMMSTNIRYSVIIQWSDEDQLYVATLPEWGCHTHGSTYEIAAKAASEVLEMLIAGEQPEDLPATHEFMFPGPSGYTYELSPTSAPKQVKNATA
jgi:antitoxin HicB